jgi:hypothetical protein
VRAALGGSTVWVDKKEITVRVRSVFRVDTGVTLLIQLTLLTLLTLPSCPADPADSPLL